MLLHLHGISNIDRESPMCGLGPYVAYSDARIRELLVNKRVIAALTKDDKYRRFEQLLCGRRSWLEREWLSTEIAVLRATIAHVRKLTGFDLSIDRATGEASISADIPHVDEQTVATIEHFGLHEFKKWGIELFRLRFVCTHIGIPIFEGVVFGGFRERETGLVQGIVPDMFIVGRTDVKTVNDYTTVWDAAGNRTIIPGQEGEGHVVESGSFRVRTTLRKAKSTARAVAEALPEWENFLLRREFQQEEQKHSEVSDSIQISDDEDDLIASIFQNE